MARLYQSYADVNPLERVALKACSVMQCHCFKSHMPKVRQTSIQVRRMKLLSQGDVDALIYEGKWIQKHLTSRVDIMAKGFWSRQQSAFFDVRVFHPNAPSYRNTSIAALYRRQEQAKKREYGDRIGEVEHASLHLRFFQQQEGSVKTPQ